MEIITSQPFYVAHQVCWEKPNFYAYFSVYAGINFDESLPEKWLPQKDLLQLIEQISQKSVFDNGRKRYQGECLVFCEDESIGEISLRISDVYKIAAPSAFLALPYSHRHYLKNQGTYNRKWLKTRWPAIAIDHKKSAFQIAPKDQRSNQYWNWDQAFEVTLNKLPSKIQALSDQAIDLFSVDQTGNFEKIALNLDLIWLIPEKNVGILAGHGVRKVTDIDATDIHALYVAENPLDQPLPLEAHKENFRQHIIAKKPSFEPEEISVEPIIFESESEAESNNQSDQKTIDAQQLEDIAPEMPKIKAELEAKLSAIKGKYADKIIDNPKEKLPQILQDVIDEKDHEVTVQKLKTYLDDINSDLQQQINTDYPDQAKSALSTGKNSPRDMLLTLGSNISDLRDKHDEALPKDALANVPKGEDVVKEVQKAITTLDEYQPDTTQEENTEMTYKDQDFSYQELSGTDFTGHDLTGANFSHANLTGAIFNRTILHNTLFTNANLQAASFVDLAITHTEFSGALLNQAKLKSVMITASQFHQTKLSEAHLENTHWHDCSLQVANFSDSDIADCHFQAGQYQKLNFEQAIIERSVFNEVSFNDLNMGYITWQESTLTDCRLENAHFINGKCSGFHCKNTTIKASDFSGAVVDKCSFDATDLSEVNFQHAQLSGAHANHNTNFNHCNFSHTNLSDASIIAALFQDCLFEETYLIEASFLQCVFKQFHLNKAYCQNASFYGCDLSNSNIEKTNLFEAQINNSNLENSLFVDCNLYDISLYLSNIKRAVFEDNLVQDSFSLIQQVQAMECNR